MLRVTTIFTGPQGSPWYNNLWFGGETSGEAFAAATAAEDFWADLASVIANGVTIQHPSEVDQVDETSGQVIASFAQTPTTSSSSGGINALPRVVQGLVRIRTGSYFNGREVRGRIFVPYPTEGSNSDPGVPNSAYTAPILTALGTLGAQGVAAGNWGVYSRTNLIFTTATSSSVWNEWAELRSRRD